MKNSILILVIFSLAINFSCKKEKETNVVVSKAPVSISVDSFAIIAARTADNLNKRATYVSAYPTHIIRGKKSQVVFVSKFDSIMPFEKLLPINRQISLSIKTYPRGVGMPVQNPRDLIRYHFQYKVDTFRILNPNPPNLRPNRFVVIENDTLFITSDYKIRNKRNQK